MKFLKLLLIFPILAFSFEIEFNKKFSKELQHDTLIAFLGVTITDEEESIVANRLKVFEEEIKNYDKVEKKLINFVIRPKYKHTKYTPKIIAYVGELKYKVNSSKATYIDEFISKVTSLHKNRDTSVTVKNLTWSVKEDTFNITLDLLRLEAIIWAERYIKILSNDLNKNCAIKRININRTDQYSLDEEKEIYSTSEILYKAIPVSESNQSKIKINPKFVLECE